MFGAYRTEHFSLLNIKAESFVTDGLPYDGTYNETANRLCRFREL